MGLIATYIFTAMSYFLGTLYVNKGMIVLCVLLPASFLAVWLHGLAHNFVAKKQGLIKKIPKNPFKNMSVVGFILLAIFGFGFTRTDDLLPDKTPKSKKILYHASGILANFCTAVILSVIEGIILFFAFLANADGLGATVYFVFDIIIWINISVAVTGLIPIPGFDGYYILKDLFFGNCKAKVLLWFEKYSKWFFLAAVVLGLTLYWCDLPVNWVFDFVGNIQSKLIDLITNGAFSASGW